MEVRAPFPYVPVTRRLLAYRELAASPSRKIDSELLYRVAFRFRLSAARNVDRREALRRFSAISEAATDIALKRVLRVMPVVVVMGRHHVRHAMEHLGNYGYNDRTHESVVQDDQRVEGLWRKLCRQDGLADPAPAFHARRRVIVERYAGVVGKQ
ncbi:MAG: hypothetical protein V1708_01655 [Candidatus Micrarchaeota archaeon]